MLIDFHPPELEVVSTSLRLQENEKALFPQRGFDVLPQMEGYKISNKELSAARTVRSDNTEESAKEEEIDVPDITAQQSGAFIHVCSF